MESSTGGYGIDKTFRQDESGKWVPINGSVLKEPIYKRSEKEAPFCPYCGDELDQLDMWNCFSECKCGKWAENMPSPISKGEYIYIPKNKKESQ